jgi:hypothetical protein
MIYTGWKSIDTDDFTCDEGHYSLRIEQLSNGKWWWAVYLHDYAASYVAEEIASDTSTGVFASTEMEAKLMAQIAQMRHQHEYDLRKAIEMARKIYGGNYLAPDEIIHKILGK